MKKDEMEDRMHALERDLDDANKEIAWLRQSIYGSEKVAKLEEEIERLKAVNADLTQDINTLKSRLLKAVDKVADYDDIVDRAMGGEGAFEKQLTQRMKDGAFE